MVPSLRRGGCLWTRGVGEQPDARVGRGAGSASGCRLHAATRSRARSRGRRVHVRDLRPRLHRREQRPARRRAPHNEDAFFKLFALLDLTMRRTRPQYTVTLALDGPALSRRPSPSAGTHPLAAAKVPPRDPAPAEIGLTRKHARAEDRPRAKYRRNRHRNSSPAVCYSRSAARASRERER